MQRNGARAGNQPDWQEKLVFQAGITPVEAGKEEFAQTLEVAGREKRFGFHGLDDGENNGECKNFL